MRRFIFLINPRAGVQKGKPLTQIIEERCHAAQQSFEIVPTVADGNYNFLIEKINAENITDVIVCGGDGTISAVASAIRHLNINIGILPRGSGNGLALAAGISRDPQKALDIIFKGNASMIDAFLINNHFSCMLSGLGFDAQVAHDFDREHKRGFWKYVKLVVKNIFSLKTFSFHIESNEKSLKTNAYFISIANSNQFGNHFTIAPRASLNDGLLDIVVVEKTNFMLLPFRVLWHIRFGTFTGNSKKSYGITYFQTPALTIHNLSPAPLHIDGDGKATTHRFEIEVIPNAYRLLVP
ncbi:MAG: YegS/Rv2252/BmrU family lipid kinase [Chitinophagaceae bacterium]|nr:YegS/Rv2252/BmrU family lipid kinase [Chitinophagaceae bacterium]